MELTESDNLELRLLNKTDTITINTEDKIQLIAKALSSSTRRQILHQIQNTPLDVSNIAANLKMTEANISAQVKKLEEAGLINCDYSSGQHGVRKISSLKYKQLLIKF